MRLPYQRYAELSHDDVHADICDFHAKQQYALLRKIKHRGQLLLNLEPQKLPEFVGKEIEFWPGIPGEISLPLPKREANSLVRNCSRLNLSDTERIHFSTIAQLISDALCRIDNHTNGFFHRPYPSGGALYPVEAFLCKTSGNIEGWPEDHSVFHIKANSRELESMRSKATASELRGLLSGFDEKIGSPYFALVYCIYLDKFIFKYKYRGYRTALMEVGSMYQMCDLYAKEFDLHNRLWAGFYDGLVGKTLNINTSSVLPCVVQFFGK